MIDKVNYINLNIFTLSAMVKELQRLMVIQELNKQIIVKVVAYSAF